MSSTPGRLLIVDDEAAQMRALCDTLQYEGYSVQGFTSAREALSLLEPGTFDLLLTDLMMPEMDGIHLIAAAREVDPELGAVVMTGHGTIDTAVRAMKGGASDYLLKPFKLDVVLPVIARTLDLRRLRRENAMLLEQQRRHAEELAVAYQDLESFSYSVSHDLRAPLRAVSGYTQMLEEGFAERLGEEGARLLGVIGDSSRRMDDLIVGLLSFSRASTQPLQRGRINMTSLVQAVLTEELAAHQGHDPHIEVGALPDAPGDATAVSQVWSNLIGNALKYSGNGPRHASPSTAARKATKPFMPWKTTAPVSTCSMPIACSASSSDCTSPRISPAPESALRSSSASSSGTEAGSGPAADPMKAPACNSHCPSDHQPKPLWSSSECSSRRSAVAEHLHQGLSDRLEIGLSSYQEGMCEFTRTA